MSRTPSFAPVRLSTLKKDVADILSDAIFSGKIKPGERVNESLLARELQVSRAPIREALQQLQEQGLIVNHPRRGMFVVDLEDEDFQKINSVRLILEAEAMRLARAHMTPEGERKLTQCVERIERSESSSPASRVKFDLEFHRAIWAMAGNEYIDRTLHSLTAPLFAYGVIRAMKTEKIRHVIHSHRPLLDFLLGRLDLPAEQVMAEHLRIPWSMPDRFSSLATPSGKRAEAAVGNKQPAR